MSAELFQQFKFLAQSWSDVHIHFRPAFINPELFDPVEWMVYFSRLSQCVSRITWPVNRGYDCDRPWTFVLSMPEFREVSTHRDGPLTATMVAWQLTFCLDGFIPEYLSYHTDTDAEWKKRVRFVVRVPPTQVDHLKTALLGVRFRSNFTWRTILERGLVTLEALNR